MFEVEGRERALFNYWEYHTRSTCFYIWGHNWIIIKITSSNLNSSRCKISNSSVLVYNDIFLQFLQDFVVKYFDPSSLISLWFGEALKTSLPITLLLAKEHCNPAFLHPRREPQPFLQLQNIVLGNAFESSWIHCHNSFQEFIMHYLTRILVWSHYNFCHRLNLIINTVEILLNCTHWWKIW